MSSASTRKHIWCVSQLLYGFHTEDEASFLNLPTELENKQVHCLLKIKDFYANKVGGLPLYINHEIATRECMLQDDISKHDRIGAKANVVVLVVIT